MVLTDDLGNATYTFIFPVTVPVGQFVTATATDPNNNTSEFSAWVVVSEGQSPPSGGGSAALLAMVHHPNDSMRLGGIDSPLSSGATVPAWSVQNEENFVSQMFTTRSFTEEIFSTARGSVAALAHPMGSLRPDVLDLLAVSLLGQDI
jgi:hypothetical protein